MFLPSQRDWRREAAMGGMMQPRFLEKRVEIVEKTVEGLSDLPGRMGRVEVRLENVEGRLERVEGRLEKVEVQIVQLRTEMRGEFSAIRDEIRQGDQDSRTFMRVLNEDTRAEVRKLAEGLEEPQTVRVLLVGLIRFGGQVNYAV